MFIVFGMSSFYIYIEIYLKYDHAYEFHGHQFPEVVSPVAMLVVVTLIAKTTRISQNLNDFSLIIQSLRGGFGGGGGGGGGGSDAPFLRDSTPYPPRRDSTPFSPFVLSSDIHFWRRRLKLF